MQVLTSVLVFIMLSADPNHFKKASECKL